MARQVTRLLADARQQIQAAAREAAGLAVSAERQVSAEQWEQKLTAAHEELSQKLSDALRKIEEESEVRSRAAYNTAAEAMQADLPVQMLAAFLGEWEARDLLGRIAQETGQGAAVRALAT